MALRASLALMMALAGGCGLRSRPVSWPWAETRADYIRRSGVWIGGALDTWLSRMRTLDLRTGPPGPGAFGPDELVECDYQKPPADVPLGNTPKFGCRRVAHDKPDEFHVKWGESNGEVYAEVAGTRLLWALGFPADRVYPVRVKCKGCAPDPWRDREPQPGTSHKFSPAIVERPFAGREIEERRGQGWTWHEIEAIDAAAGGAPRVHVDALKLLAAFMQHRDSKEDNQRLVCPDDAVVAAGTPGQTCRRPLMMIHDLGSTFGGPKPFGTQKMRVESWEREPVWDDPHRCVANLSEEHDAQDGLEYPHIGEEGRLFLARLLEGLDDAQIAGLFEAARGGRRGGEARWVAVFEAKREQVLHPVPGDASFHCPRGR
jgi:hypothetical protein